MHTLTHRLRFVHLVNRHIACCPEPEGSNRGWGPCHPLGPIDQASAATARTVGSMPQMMYDHERADREGCMPKSTSLDDADDKSL